jgi:hypothetical protein
MGLANVLRLCKILAVRLNHDALKEWVDNELNGYKDFREVPDYRVITGLECQGHFFGAFGSAIRNGLIPLSVLPEQARKPLTTKYYSQGVSALESTVNQARASNHLLIHHPWPADIVNWLGSDIYEGMVCGQAWTPVPVAFLVSILDTVRTRILDFVLEIEAKFPNAGEAQPGEQPIPPPVLKQYFYNCILHHPSQSGSTINKQNEATYMSDSFTNNMQGANIGNMANELNDSASQQAIQNINATPEQKTLAQSAAEIQALLKQLEQTNPTATEEQQIAYVNEETGSGFKNRAVAALRAAGESAIDVFISENKYLQVAKAAIKGWAEGN